MTQFVVRCNSATTMSIILCNVLRSCISRMRASVRVCVCLCLCEEKGTVNYTIMLE